MPLVAHNGLPTFQRLKDQGLEVLSLERAQRQNVRELHIGFLNMMPDAALAATEQQFIRLVGSSQSSAQFYVYPFSLAELNRGDDASKHIAEHYFNFSELRNKGLDALIITGANVINPDLENELFWEPLMQVAEWAENNVVSKLCSCLATHALVNHFHGIRRQPLQLKQWGVYEHHIKQPGHPLMQGIDKQFDAPHSRFNEITGEQLVDAGLTVLIESPDAGIHLAVGPDQFRTVYFQGHPEYDAVSLLKEYKREINRYLDGELQSPPPLPENYLSQTGEALAHDFIEKCLCAGDTGTPVPAFPEAQLEREAHNTWEDTAKIIVDNWLNLVFKLASQNRQQQFVAHVDPDDPLGIRG